MDTQGDTLQLQFFLDQQRDLKEIGIELRANRVTWQEMMQRVKGGKAQMWGVAWGADYPEAQNFLQCFYGPNEAPGPNEANFHDEEFDALYKRAASMQPTEERKDLYRRMQR